MIYAVWLLCVVYKTTARTACVSLFLWFFRRLVNNWLSIAFQDFPYSLNERPYVPKHKDICKKHKAFCFETNPMSMYDSKE